jgi:hypothetical protein
MLSMSGQLIIAEVPRNFHSSGLFSHKKFSTSFHNISAHFLICNAKETIKYYKIAGFSRLV